MVDFQNAGSEQRLCGEKRFDACEIKQQLTTLSKLSKGLLEAMSKEDPPVLWFEIYHEK